MTYLFNSAEIFLVNEISSGGGGVSGRHLWVADGQRGFGDIVAGGKSSGD